MYQITKMVHFVYSTPNKFSFYFSSAEQVVKDFTKPTEVLPFNKCGLSTLSQFKEAASDLEHLENLKKAGLTEEEIKLYHDFEDGTLNDKKTKIESTILEQKLNTILTKLSSHNDSKNSRYLFSVSYLLCPLINFTHRITITKFA